VREIGLVGGGLVRPHGKTAGAPYSRGTLSPLIPPSGTFSPSGEKDRRQELRAIRTIANGHDPTDLGSVVKQVCG